MVSSESTSDPLNLISEQVDNMNTFINEIADASKEQTQAISQINTAITEVNQGVLQGINNAKKLSHISQTIKGYSAQLALSLDQFKLDESGSA